jgi:hypothetical protein
MKKKTDAAELPDTGAAFAFPIGDGRFSVIRVLVGQTERWKGKVVLAACSSWIGGSIPSADDPALRRILRKNYHSWDNALCIIWTSETIPDDFLFIGNIAPTSEEKDLVCNTFGLWKSLRVHPLAQWRWENDRDAVLVEDAAKAKREAEVRRQSRLRREEYLNRITLAELRDHKFFPQWKLPPKKSILASRRIMTDTVNCLLELGFNSPEAERIEVLHECIESFNELDARSYFVETEEREDICREFEAIIHACGLASQKEDLIDRWRKW